MLENTNIPEEELPSFSTHKNVFSKKNLSFHTPKKDQCSLYMTYTKGEETVKAKFKERYDEHIKKPYIVVSMQARDFLDFKGLFCQQESFEGKRH